MFDRLAQFVGVLAILPVAGMAIATLAIPLMAYTGRALRQTMLTSLLGEIYRRLDENATPLLSVKQRTQLYALQKEVDRGKSLYSGHSSDLATIAILAGRTSDPGYLLKLQSYRNTLQQSSLQLLNARFANADLEDLLRSGQTWIGLELFRLNRRGFKDFGYQSLRRFLSRTSSTVTEYGTLGLMVGASIWLAVFILRLPNGRFLHYIGNGVTLGAFAGLAIAAYKAYTSALAPALSSLPPKTLRIVVASIAISSLIAAIYAGLDYLGIIDRFFRWQLKTEDSLLSKKGLFPTLTIALGIAFISFLFYTVRVSWRVWRAKTLVPLSDRLQALGRICTVLFIIISFIGLGVSTIKPEPRLSVDYLILTFMLMALAAGVLFFASWLLVVARRHRRRKEARVLGLKPRKLVPT